MLEHPSPIETHDHAEVSGTKGVPRPMDSRGSVGPRGGETRWMAGHADRSAGLLAREPVTLEQYRREAERVLVDAIEPMEELTQGGGN